LSQVHKNLRRQRNKQIEVHSFLPVGVTLIAVFYLFGAGVLLFSLFTSQHNEVCRYIATVYNLPPDLGIYSLIFTIGIAIFIAVGLFTLARWGWYLTILYLIYFGSINCFLMIEKASQPYYGNFIWSFMVIIYLLVTRKKFL
jgi:hypothetical protein